MSYQVGETRIFSLQPPTGEGLIYSYVWHWWDGTTDATTVPWIQKTINMGGQPGTGLLNYSCTPVAANGQTAVRTASVEANNPPVLISPAVVTVNDAYFPYDTSIQVKAYDFEDGAGQLSFEWSEDGAVLATNVGIAAGTVMATWKGNGTTVTGSRPVAACTFPVPSVTRNRKIDLKVTDSTGGATYFQVELRGAAAPPAVLGGSGAGVAAEGRAAALVRVGPAAQVVFETYARDPQGKQVYFSWNFAGSNAWTVVEGPLPGEIVQTADGGYKSTVLKLVGGELFPDGDRKTAVAVATVSWSTGYTELQMPVTLMANTAPSALTFTVKVGGEDYPLGSGQPVDPGSFVEFSARATDLDLDLIEYQWTFIQPLGATPPSTLRLWGAKAALDTTNWPAGSKVQATVTATDRFGASISEVTPAIPITPAAAPFI